MTTALNKTPMWLIERVAQDELAPAEVEQLRQRLAAEGRLLEAELASLSASDREILSRLPRQSIVPAIRQRASREPAPSTPRRFRLLLAPALLLGAAALVTVRATQHGAVIQPAPSADEEIGIKGDIPSSPRLLVFRQKAAKASGPPGAERLSDGAHAARGDVLQLAYDKAPDGLFGVLLSIDGAGRVTQHLPEEGAAASAPLTSLRETPLPSAYELDDAPEFERFILITSKRPFAVDVVQAAARAIVHEGSSARTLPLALDPSFGQTSVSLNKTGKGAP